MYKSPLNLSQAPTFTGHMHNVNSAVFSPDGKKVVTGSSDSTARIWDAQSGTELLKLEGHTGYVNSAAFSPDGMKIVTAGSSDSTARIWDAESGSELLKLEGHTNYVSSAAFSPDGRKVVTASSDKTARIWDAESGKELQVLKGHWNLVKSAAFSPDGATIVTSSLNGTVRIWDAESGRNVKKFGGSLLSLRYAAFSPDGMKVVAAGGQIARICAALPGKKMATIASVLEDWGNIEEKLPVGSIIQGTVVKMVKTGALIEIEEGIDGLLHISNMHWTRKIWHPSEVVQNNQPITCKVLSVDKENRRIALGLKQLSEDPWVTRIPQKYQVGQIVIGTVVKMMNIGIVIDLEDDLTGFLHVSELASYKAENPGAAVEVGKKIVVKVIRVDLDNRKLGLGSTLSKSAQLQELPLRRVNPLALMGTRIMNKIHELLG